MGTWGYEIDQDDFVCDILAEFEQHLKHNQNLQQTTELLVKSYQDFTNDPDNGPLLWIALASMQWKYGRVDDPILTKVKTDYEQEIGLERWKGIGETEYRRRKDVLAKFIQKISSENSRPKKIPRIVVRKPVYQAGNCLCVTLKNDMFGAALVLAADHSDMENGHNLIVTLNYMESTEPDLSVFEKRDFLILTHHDWESKMEIAWYGAQGYRSAKSRFKLVGNIPVPANDVQECNRFAGWAYLGNQIADQREWDLTKK